MKPVITDIGRSYLRLKMIPDVGPIRAANLVRYFGSPEAVFGATSYQLSKVDRVGEKVAYAVLKAAETDLSIAEVEKAEQAGVLIRCVADDDYPAHLRQIPDPPVCIYIRGDLQPTDGVSMAIVGTRRCSHYGLEQAARFGEMLASAGFTVVSGLARGVDGAGHEGALRVGGRTIGVLGNGLPEVYPPEHRILSERMERQGAIISELPMGTPPDASHFPARNRIIVGMSLGVLVIEAGVKSGALITANLAHDYSREVFALPGRIDTPATSSGTNQLIRDGGAKLVTCLDDILHELGDVGVILAKYSISLDQGQDRAEHIGDGSLVGSGVEQLIQTNGKLSEDESRVVRVLAQGPVHIDHIVEQTGLPVGRISALLTTLQLQSVVQSQGGQFYEIRRHR